MGPHTRSSAPERHELTGENLGSNLIKQKQHPIWLPWIPYNLILYSNSHLCLRIYKFIQPGLFIFKPNLGFKINFSNTCTGYGVYCIVLSTQFLSLKAPLCASATPTLSVRGRPFFIFFFFILWVEL